MVSTPKIQKQQQLKRWFDLPVTLVALLILFFPMLLLIVIASFSTRQSGVFKQKRIGRFGKTFTIYKIRTMKVDDGKLVVTPFGKFLRKYKLDELPQLYNILLGDMSFVGPRPDLPGYADKLKGHDQIILQVRPGLTSPATIKYKNEADILQQQENPQQYNDEVLWPDKVQLNKAYIENWSFWKDIVILWKTIFS